MNKVLLKQMSNAGGSCTLEASISPNGNLVIEGYDIGPQVKELVGDSDYEYSVTIPESHVNDFLLVLLKDRYAPDQVPFKDVGEVQALCKENGIPCEFWSWA